MSVFFDELKRIISRLSKREVKLALNKGKGLRKENQVLRARVKALEATMKKALRTIARSGIKVSSAQPGDLSEVKRFRLTARGIRSLRKKTRLSQSAFAKLVDTSVLSVSNWELGKALPRKSSDAFRKMIEVRNSKMGARAARKALEAMSHKK